MPSALEAATIQSALLNITSSILAQLLTSYRKAKPLHAKSLLNPLGLDFLPIAQILIFSLLSTPPNFLWQAYLERRFPGYPVDKGKQKLKVDDDGKGVVIEKGIDIPNTLIKFLLDQTLGAAVNTIAFLVVVTALKGGSWGDCIDIVKTDFWPIMVAGYKLWPIVSIANFTIVPVERRVLVGSIVGLGWGVFMALRITPDA